MGGRSYPAEIAHLPEMYRKAIYDQCGGTWARVTVERGIVTVHNRPQPGGLKLSRAAKTPVKRAVKKPAPPPARGPLPAPPPVRRPTVLPAAPEATPEPTVIPRPTLTPFELERWQLTPHATQRLNERAISAADALQCAEFPELVTPGDSPGVEVRLRGRIKVVVNPVERRVLTVMHRPVEDPSARQAPRPLRPAGEVLSQEPAFQAAQEPDVLWSLMPGDETGAGYDPSELAEAKAWRLAAQVRDGLGDRSPLVFHGDVTALNGVDLAQVESVARHADRVEVDPGSVIRDYPVLKFHRGDNMVVVGFLDLRQPMVIAAYFNTSRNLSSGARGTAGGGGSRKRTGVPTSVNQLLSALQGIGVTIAEPGLGDEVVAISYQDSDLGKVPCVATATKQMIEQAWQRAQRRVDAIKQREAAGKTG